LIPGIFLDHYTLHGGQLSGQYILCPLVDFEGSSLQSNVPKSTFKFRLIRTEVAKRKANCVLPIFPLKARYNRANYSLDGEDGSVVNTTSGGYEDIEDPDSSSGAGTDDVEFDPLVYDYVIPKAKNIDALRIQSNVETGGIDIVRIPPAKYVWDQLWELHGALDNVIPTDMKTWTGAASSEEATGSHSEPLVEDSEADLASHPFVEDAGGVVGTEDDSLTNPEFFLESDVIARVVMENFNSEEWQNRSTTSWTAHEGVYIVKKSNDRINMPALDGKSGAPRPCMIAGERWTFAWPSTASIPGDGPGLIRYHENQLIICDNFHQYQSSKTNNVKIALNM